MRGGFLTFTKQTHYLSGNILLEQWMYQQKIALVRRLRIFWHILFIEQKVLEHGQQASVIEQSSYVADTPFIANTYPRRPVPQNGPMLFRIPISREILKSLKDDLFAIA